MDDPLHEFSFENFYSCKLSSMLKHEVLSCSDGLVRCLLQYTRFAVLHGKVDVWSCSQDIMSFLSLLQCAAICLVLCHFDKTETPVQAPSISCRTGQDTQSVARPAHFSSKHQGTLIAKVPI